MGRLPKPRVFQVVGSLGIGGAEQIAIAVAIGVSQHGWDSVVVSATGNRDLDRCKMDLQAAGVHIETLSRSWISKMVKAMSLARQYQPTLVHVHTELPELIGMLMKSVTPRTHLVRTIHNQARWPDHATMRALTHIYYRLWSSQQYACSPAAAMHGEPVILNGVPWTTEIPDKNPFLVSFVGRMEAQKNPAGVIEIVRLARMQDNRIKLRMVGGGSLLADLKRKYNDEWIEWLGPRSDAPWHIGQSVVAVFASGYEGLPLVAVEALTRLTSVLAPDISGFQGMDWVTLYQPGNWGEASQKLLKMMVASRAEALTIARSLHQEQYAQGRMVENYLAEYRKILYPGQVASQEHALCNAGTNSDSAL